MSDARAGRAFAVLACGPLMSAGAVSTGGIAAADAMAYMSSTVWPIYSCCGATALRSYCDSLAAESRTRGRSSSAAWLASAAASSASLPSTAAAAIASSSSNSLFWKF